MQPLSIVLLSIAISLLVSGIMCARLEKKILKSYILFCLECTLSLFESVDKIANALRKACKENEEE